MSVVLDTRNSYLASVKAALVHVLLPAPHESLKVMGPLAAVIAVVVVCGIGIIAICLVAMCVVPLVHLFYFLAGLMGFVRAVEKPKTKEV